MKQFAFIELLYKQSDLYNVDEPIHNLMAPCWLPDFSKVRIVNTWEDVGSVER